MTPAAFEYLRRTILLQQQPVSTNVRELVALYDKAEAEVTAALLCLVMRARRDKPRATWARMMMRNVHVTHELGMELDHDTAY